MMPVLPKPSQVSGALCTLSDALLRGVASIAITFINLNKYITYRKNFSFSSGKSGNKVNCLYIGNRLNKFSASFNPIQQEY